MPEHAEPDLAYLALKAARKLYGKAPDALKNDELDRVRSLAQQQHRVKRCVLMAPEAVGVMVPRATLDSALQEISARYRDADEFAADLQRNGLDAAGLALALECEMKVEAILEKIGSRAEDVSDMDVRLYYEYHPDQFRRPETRQVRHILITINAAIAENTRAQAYARIAAIHTRLLKVPQRFEEQALKHSECPTALDGGRLGDLPRGKLFPVLDKALFELQPGAVSGILESELGFHLLRCDAISAAGVLGFEQAGPHIRKLMERRRRRACQQHWVKQLVAHQQG